MMVDWSEAAPAQQLRAGSSTEIGWIAIGEAMEVESREEDTGFTRLHRISGSLSASFRRNEPMMLKLLAGTGVMVFGILVQEALRMRPSTVLGLVDQGFRIPFIDPSGSVPWAASAAPRSLPSLILNDVKRCQLRDKTPP